jgi:hypothetical protein
MLCALKNPLLPSPSVQALKDSLRQIKRALDHNKGNNGIANSSTQVRDRGTKLKRKFMID